MCLASALDIIRAGQPPRATFVDYPLGHTAGKPFDPRDQLSIIRGALSGFEAITVPGEILTLPNRWDADEEWQYDAASTEATDTRQARDETPQFQFADDRLAAIASGALE